MTTYVFKVVVEPDEDKWSAYCPALLKQGGSTWGNTKEEALQHINWLRVLDTTEPPHIDQGVGHQLHAVVPMLDALKAQQQPFEFVLPRKRPLHAIP